MNGKKAKRLRRQAKGMMCEYIRDRILPPDLTEGESCDSLLVVLPERAVFWKGFTRYLGIGSKKWFYRQVKKHPTLTYQDFLEKIYEPAKQA